MAEVYSIELTYSIDCSLTDLIDYLKNFIEISGKEGNIGL